MWETIREKVHARQSSFEAGIVSALVSSQRIGTSFVRKLSTVTGPYMRLVEQKRSRCFLADEAVHGGDSTIF